MSRDDTEDGLGALIGSARQTASDLEARRLLAKVRRRLANVDDPVRLGRYTIGDRLGAGALGVVYEAHDDRLARDVAIKVIRLDDGRSRERVIAEARALAELAHPNIVEVFDVVVDDDVLGIVMERLRGRTLEGWRAPEVEVRRVFARVAAGLAAAHERGLCHRDVKPDNVFLADDGRPRLIDFGLAALEDPRARVGTPAYAAPELARGEGGDARSDQYSFCVMVHEALTGTRPGPGARPPPSRIAAVLARGLAADPARRFPSMRDLLRELDRRPGPLRWAVPACVAASVLLFAWPRPAPPCPVGEHALPRAWNDARWRGIAGAFADASPFGVDVAPRVETAIDHYATQWSAAREEACRASSISRLRCLQRALTRLDGMLAVFEQADDAVVQRAAGAVSQLPDPTACDEPVAPDVAPAFRTRLDHARMLYDLGRYDAALDEAIEIGRDARDQGEGAAITEARWLEGVAHADLGESTAAIAALRDAFDRAERLGLDVIGARAAASLVGELGTGAGDLAGAEQWVRHAEARIARGGVPGDVDAALRLNWGTALYVHGRAAEALASYEGALASMRSAVAEDDPRIATCLTAITSALLSLRRFDDAVERQSTALAIYEGALGPAHPRIAIARHNLGSAYAGLRRYEDAIAELDAALALQQRQSGPDHPDVASTLLSLAWAHAERGDNEQALAAYGRAAAVFDAAAHPMAHRAHRGEATALARMGRVEDAVIAQRRAVEQLVATRGTDHRDTVDAEVNLAEFLLESGDTDEARAVLRRIREAGVSSSTEPHLVRVEGLLALALGQRSRAVELFERALQSGELPPLAEAWTRYGLARALYPHDRARAIAEATAARDALRPFPHQHTEVVTWLAKHG